MDSEVTVENAILVKGLVKKYKEVVALAGIDFEVPVGTVFGLLGPNGAGKTTAIRILATVLRPDGGRAEVMGHDVSREPAAVRCNIGLAGQSAAVDPNLTGWENLRMIGRLAQMRRAQVRPRADDLLEIFGLSDAANRPVRTYSGGMRRRLDVAAALMAQPPVIFLDEPTTGLDIQSRTELWGRIRALVAEGSTVLLTTQYLEEADRLADRIAVVDAGLVVANDTAAGLKARLSGSVIEVGMGTPEKADRAEAVVSKLPGKLERVGVKLRVLTKEVPRVLTEVLRELEQAGLAPETLTVHEPSLDDVFLVITGTHARSEAAAAAAAATEEGEGE